MRLWRCHMWFCWWALYYRLTGVNCWLRDYDIWAALGHYSEWKSVKYQKCNLIGEENSQKWPIDPLAWQVISTEDVSYSDTVHPSIIVLYIHPLFQSRGLESSIWLTDLQWSDIPRYFLYGYWRKLVFIYVHRYCLSSYDQSELELRQVSRCEYLAKGRGTYL